LPFVFELLHAISAAIPMATHVTTAQMRFFDTRPLLARHASVERRAMLPERAPPVHGVES
jgi:hypothetical protein